MEKYIGRKICLIFCAACDQSIFFRYDKYLASYYRKGIEEPARLHIER
jgi:hypothetical protein